MGRSVAAGDGGKRLTRSGQKARERVAKRVFEDLLRAGPTATRQALRADWSLASFLPPEDFARLAEYAKPKPERPKPPKVGADVLERSRQRRLSDFVFSVVIAIAIASITYVGVMEIAK